MPAAYVGRMAISDDISASKCMALTTYRRSGAAVTTPVWVTQLHDGRIGFYTSMGSGKTKRLKANAHVTVQPCSYRGKPKPGTSPHDGTAELLQGGPDFDEIQTGIRRKYGVMASVAKLAGGLAMKRKGLKYADSVVAIRLDA